MNKHDELVSQVKHSISNSQTGKALGVLTKAQLSEIDRDLIILNSRYTKLKEDQRLGVVSDDLAQRKINTINRDILDLLEKIEGTSIEKPNLTGVKIEGGKFNIWWGVIPLLIAAFGGAVFMMSKDSTNHLSISEIENSLEKGAKISTILSNGGKTSDFYGLSYKGGIIFYIDSISGKGLMAAQKDQGVAGYGCFDLLCGSNERKDGKANTRMILRRCNEENYAAILATNHRGGGYADWFLPSIHELEQMYNNIGEGAVGARRNIGEFYPKEYRSSTEEGKLASWQLHFETGKIYTNSKKGHYRVRAIRVFE